MERAATRIPLIRTCSSLVIRCFRGVEHFADWVTGAAGPVFVFLCWVLIGSGGFFFFDVIVRDLSLTSLFFLSPFLVFVPLNLYTQYYLVTHVPPGFPSPRASGADKDLKWLITDPKSIWSAERWGFRKRRPLTAGITELRAGDRMGETGRRVRRCRKCDGPKPEIYLNPYDLGKRRNLQLFFNLGPSGYSPLTLLFPFLIPPTSNGWSFLRRPLPSRSPVSLKLHAPELGEGLIARTNGQDFGPDINGNAETECRASHAEDGHGGYVMGDDGSLTDDEEGGGGWMEY
nr:vacuolar protein [Cryptococcus depauperatus CBS 7855]